MSVFSKAEATSTPGNGTTMDLAAQIAVIASRLDRLPQTRTIWTIILLISAGGIFEFYDVFFTAYVAPGMVRTGLFTPQSLGFFTSLTGVAISGVGTFVFSTFSGLWLGAVAFGKMADRLGRKPVFTGALLWYIACTAIMAFQTTGETLNIWRFLAGLGFGVQLITIDTYISELVPSHLRGTAFSVNQCVTFAVVPVIAFLAWILVPLHPFGMDGWRIVVLIGSVGAVFVWFLAASIPESPRWLATRGRIAEAEAIMVDLEAKVGAEYGRPLPSPAAPVEEVAGEGGFVEIFSRKYRTRTVMLSFFNATQVIGFFGFNAWVPTLLIARGINVTHSLEYSFIIAISQPFGPALGALFADKVERKHQIIGGLLVMGIAIAVFATLSNPLALIAVGVIFTLAANVMSYAYHSYQTELYPTRIRAQAVGFVYSWSRLSAAFSGLAVGYFLHTGGVPAVAVFIGVAMFAAIAAIGIFGPRTMKLTLEDINR